MSDNTHLLVVDDDDRLRELIKNYLIKQGFQVTAVADATQARLALKEFIFDLLILDVMMPKEDGISLMGSIRAFNDVPILLLTAMAESEQRILGLESGADDYLTKPFEPKELVLRVQSILRRVRQNKPIQEIPCQQFGDLYFDFTSEVLQDGQGKVIALTSSSLLLLRELMKQAGKVIPRDELGFLSNIQGGDRSIDVQIARLRQKIEPDPKHPRYICTVHGQGYVFKP